MLPLLLHPAPRNALFLGVGTGTTLTGGARLPGVTVEAPIEATYLAWLDCRDLGLGNDPAAVFLERGRVAFNSGPTFGTGGEGHVRVNIATSGEILEEAVSRMVASL